MALPTVTQLLLPSLSWSTIVGALLILIGVFKGSILNFIGKGLEFLSGGRIESGALRVAFIGGGIVMVWLPSIIQDLFRSVEGIMIFVGVIVFLVVLVILFSKAKKEDGGVMGL